MIFLMKSVITAYIYDSYDNRCDRCRVYNTAAVCLTYVYIPLLGLHEINNFLFYSIIICQNGSHRVPLYFNAFNLISAIRNQ